MEKIKAWVIVDKKNLEEIFYEDGLEGGASIYRTKKEAKKWNIFEDEIIPCEIIIHNKKEKEI